jgi:hypothetical protein
MKHVSNKKEYILKVLGLTFFRQEIMVDFMAQLSMQIVNQVITFGTLTFLMSFQWYQYGKNHCQGGLTISMDLWGF